MICQVAGVGTDELFCPATESGGYRCEGVMRGPDHVHVIYPHTIRHAMAGSGFSCEEVNRAWG